MINCEKGTVTISGLNLDIATDFLQIVDTLMETEPVIIIASIGHRAKELSKLTDNCDPNFVQVLDRIYTDIDKERAKHEQRNNQ